MEIAVLSIELHSNRHFPIAISVEQLEQDPGRDERAADETRELCVANAIAVGGEPRQTEGTQLQTAAVRFLLNATILLKLIS